MSVFDRVCLQGTYFDQASSFSVQGREFFIKFRMRLNRIHAEDVMCGSRTVGGPLPTARTERLSALFQACHAVPRTTNW